MVGTCGEVVLVADLRRVIGKCANVAGRAIDNARVGKRIKREIGDDRRVDRNADFARARSIDTDQTAASICVWNITRDADPLVLPESFIVSEDKSTVVNDGAPCGAAKLIAAEFGDLSGEVELISSIERTVAKKFISASVQFVG